MKHNWPIWMVLAISACCSQRALSQRPIDIAEVQRAAPVSFSGDIIPILRRSCLACHSASEKQGDLVLESAALLLKGGDHGTAAVPGKSGDSLLLKLASHRVEPFMPPPNNDVAAKPLTPQELGLIKLWIDQGAREDSATTTLSPRNWRPLPRGINPIYAVAITPDGQYVACSRANQIFVYHARTGQLITRLIDPPLSANAPGSVLPIAHLDLVQSLALNNEGDLLASGSFREVKLWRRPRDVTRFTLAAAQDAVTALAVSPDGKWMATGAADKQIKVWRVDDGAPGPVLTGHDAQITSLRFSRDGERVFSASLDKTIRVWNVADGQLIGRIDSPSPHKAIELITPPRTADSALPATEWIVSADADNLLRVWQAPQGLNQPLGSMPAKPSVAAVSPDGKLLAIGNAEGHTQIFDLTRSQVLAKWKSHDSAVLGVAFKPLPAPGANAPADQPNVQLATCSADATIRVWNIAAATIENPPPLLVALRGSLGAVECVAYSPDGKQLIAGAVDGTVTIWNVETPAPRDLADDRGGAVNVMALTPNGKLVAYGASDKDVAAILVRDMESGNLIHSLLGHDGPITALAFSPDATRLVSGAADKTARVWDLTDAKFPELARYAGHGGAVIAVAFSGDGGQIVSGAGDNTLKLWRAADGKELMNFSGHTAHISAVAFGAGNQPISASADRSIRFWNASNGQATRTVTDPAPINAMVMSRDGARLAVAGADNAVRIYSSADGQLLLNLVGHKSAARTLAFSFDNTRLISAAADERAIVWESATGRLIEILPAAGLTAAVYATAPNTVLLAGAEGRVQGHSLHFSTALAGITKRITAVIWHPNGQNVFLASEDGTVRGFQCSNAQPMFAANHGSVVHDLALSPNGQVLASAGEDKLIKLCSAANGGQVQPSQLVGFTGPVHSVAFTADGLRLIGGGSAPGHELLVFDAATGAPDETFVAHTGSLETIAGIAGHGDQFVSLSTDETVRRWSILLQRRIAGHGQPVTSLAAIPDVPTHLISGSEDGTLRRWDVATGQQLFQLNHGGPVTAVAVRSDGQRIASASSNGSAKLWIAGNGQQLAEVRGDIRTKLRAARLTQQQSGLVARRDLAKQMWETAEKELPTKMAAAKTAADALAAVNRAVDEKKGAFTAAEQAKSASEKVAIETAAMAQKTALVQREAEQLVAQATAMAKFASDKATRLTTAAQTDQTLAAAATAAQQQAVEAMAKAKSASDAVAAPTQAATTASTAANDAAAKVTAAQKPYADALAALRQAELAQNQAAQTNAIALREAEIATAAVPASQDALAAAEAALAQVQKDLEAATKTATAAEQPLRTLAFSPNGQQLLIGGDYPAINAWNTENGSAVTSFEGHTASVRALEFASGDTLIAGSSDKSVRAWDLNPGWNLERRLGAVTDADFFPDRVAALDFSEDGQFLVTGSGEPSRSGELKIWKVADGTLVQAIPNAHNDSVLGVQFSPDGKQVASCGADKYVRTFDVATGKLLRRFEGHTHHVLAVAWKSDDKVLASASADNTIKVWSAESGDQILSIGGFARHVTGLRFVGDSLDLVSSAGDRLVRLHRSNDGGNFLNLSGATDYLYSVDVTSDRQLVVAGGHDSVLRIWNGSNGQLLQALEAPKEPALVETKASTK